MKLVSTALVSIAQYTYETYIYIILDFLTATLKSFVSKIILAIYLTKYIPMILFQCVIDTLKY